MSSFMEYFVGLLPFIISCIVVQAILDGLIYWRDHKASKHHDKNKEET